jgi:hypothetical protein
MEKITHFDDAVSSLVSRQPGNVRKREFPNHSFLIAHLNDSDFLG